MVGKARLARSAAPPATTDRGAALGGLARGSVLAFGTYVVGTALTCLSQLLVARLVGSVSYGYYAYALAWMAILAYVAALGFDVSLLRLIPAYCAMRRWSLARGVLRYAQHRNVAASCLIVVAAALMLEFRANAVPAEQVRTFLIGLALVPMLSLLWISSAAARAFGAVVAALAPDRIVRDGGVVVALLGMSLWRGTRFDASSVMATLVGCTLIGLIAVRAVLRRYCPPIVAAAAPEYAAAIWRVTAIPLVSISASETLLNRTGVILFGWLGDGIAAGVFALAFNISMTVILPRTAVNARFAPLVSEFFVRGDQAGLQSMVTRTATWTLLSGLCIAMPLAIVAQPLLSWFGPGFARGVTAMRVLLAGQVVACAFGPQMVLMTMTGNERRAAVLLGASTIFGAALGWNLIHSMGLTGAAIAASAAFVAWNASMAVFVRRSLGLVPGTLAYLGMKRVTGKQLGQMSAGSPRAAQGIPSGGPPP